MAKLSQLDFSEFRVYVDQLLDAGSVDDRHECAGIIARLCQTLPRPEWGESLANAAWRFAVLGEQGDELQLELLKLVEAHSGSMAARAVVAEMADDQRQLGLVHGVKGGRPPTGNDEKWLELFIAKKRRNSALSDTEAFRQIAAEWGSGDSDKRRSWRAIRDGVKRARSHLKKPDS